MTPDDIRAEPDGSQEALKQGDRLFEFSFLIVKCYQYVVVVFLGALIGGWLGSAGDLAIRFLEIESPVVVRHACWIALGIITAVGYPLGWVKVNGKRFKLFEDKARTKSREKDIPQEKGEPSKIIPSALFFALVGAFIGLMFGGSLTLTWFSVAISPWPPEGWLEAVSSSGPDVTAAIGSMEREGGMTTDHPIAAWLFFGPILTLAAMGLVIGAVGAAMGWITEPPKKGQQPQDE